MLIKIGKHFEFEASHYLPQNKLYGKCSNLHGHRYELVVEICGDISNEGWICNFSNISEMVQDNIINQFDHAHLNDYIEIPTAENICRYILERLMNYIKINGLPFSISKIQLYETQKCYCLIEV